MIKWRCQLDVQNLLSIRVHLLLVTLGRCNSSQSLLHIAIFASDVIGSRMCVLIIFLLPGIRQFILPAPKQISATKSRNFRRALQVSRDSWRCPSHGRMSPRMRSETAVSWASPRSSVSIAAMSVHQVQQGQCICSLAYQLHFLMCKWHPLHIPSLTSIVHQSCSSPQCILSLGLCLSLYSAPLSIKDQWGRPAVPEVKLLMRCRMTEAIAELPSQQWYGGRLETGGQPRGELIPGMPEMSLVNISSRRETRIGTSWQAEDGEGALQATKYILTNILDAPGSVEWVAIQTFVVHHAALWLLDS